jgi:hypothetical protein
MKGRINGGQGTLVGYQAGETKGAGNRRLPPDGSSVAMFCEPMGETVARWTDWQIRSGVILNSPPSPFELEREVKL